MSKDTQEILAITDAQIKAAQNNGILGNLGWKEIIAILGALGVTNGTQLTAWVNNRPSADDVCVERVEEQNKACHEMIRQCIKIAAE